MLYHDVLLSLTYIGTSRIAKTQYINVIIIIYIVYYIQSLRNIFVQNTHNIKKKVKDISYFKIHFIYVYNLVH